MDLSIPNETEDPQCKKNGTVRNQQEEEVWPSFNCDSTTTPLLKKLCYMSLYLRINPERKIDVKCLITSNTSI